MIQSLESCIREKADLAQLNQCRTDLATNEHLFLELSSVAQLSGNVVRLKILYLLQREGELCPCDLSDILCMTIPAVSQHLRKLREGQLVEYRKERQTVFYSLNSQHLDQVLSFFNLLKSNLESDE